MMPSKKVSVLVMTALFLIPTLALAFSGGAPNGRTGAPGETTCTGCHSTFPLNSGTGSLNVTDLSNWQPGQDYDLTVTVDDPDASRWGFSFTVLNEAGDSVGTLSALDGNTQTASSGSRDYAKQTSSGTQSGTTSQASWTMRWTAPAAGTGNVTLYMAGNAANGNGATSGDHIYADSFSWAEGTASPVPMPVLAGAELGTNYPNPFNPRTTLVFELARAQEVQLAIYSVDGRLVKQLVNGYRAEGRHEMAWDGLDQSGRAVPSGTYLYRLNSGGLAQTRTMTLVR